MPHLIIPFLRHDSKSIRYFPWMHIYTTIMSPHFKITSPSLVFHEIRIQNHWFASPNSLQFRWNSSFPWNYYKVFRISKIFLFLFKCLVWSYLQTKARIVSFIPKIQDQTNLCLFFKASRKQQNWVNNMLYFNFF